MPLGRAREPFSHSEWIYEVKWDGLRALTRIDRGVCRLVPRNGNLPNSVPDQPYSMARSSASTAMGRASLSHALLLQS